MSTYAIADAINKLADNLKYAIGTKNQIEKEKFEFYKALEEEKFKLNNQHLDLDTTQIEHDCNWIVSKAEAVTKEEAGCVTYYTQRCSVCGKE